jgi:hypothetical protein
LHAKDRGAAALGHAAAAFRVPGKTRGIIVGGIPLGKRVFEDLLTDPSLERLILLPLHVYTGSKSLLENSLRKF